MRDLYSYVRSLVKSGSRTLPLNIFAGGDHVIVEARGAMTTRAGETYDNEYCRIVEMREYCDSVLCEARLGVFQAGKGDDLIAHPPVQLLIAMQVPVWPRGPR